MPIFLILHCNLISGLHLNRCYFHAQSKLCQAALVKANYVDFCISNTRRASWSTLMAAQTMRLTLVFVYQSECVCVYVCASGLAANQKRKYLT